MHYTTFCLSFALLNSGLLPHSGYRECCCYKRGWVMRVCTKELQYRRTDNRTLFSKRVNSERGKSMHLSYAKFFFLLHSPPNLSMICKKKHLSIGKLYIKAHISTSLSNRPLKRHMPKLTFWSSPQIQPLLVI